MIDPNKPLRFKGDDRVVTLVGTMPNGDVVVTSTYDDGSPWLFPSTFRKDTGRPLAGNGLVLENAPVRNSGFYPLRPINGGGVEPYGRGMTLLSGVWEDYTANFAVEIVCVDKKPVEAIIHARPARS